MAELLTVKQTALLFIESSDVDRSALHSHAQCYINKTLCVTS